MGSQRKILQREVDSNLRAFAQILVNPAASSPFAVGIQDGNGENSSFRGIATERILALQPVAKMQRQVRTGIPIKFNR